MRNPEARMQPVSQEPDSKPVEQVALEDCLLTLLRGIQKHVAGADDELAALEARFKETDNPRELVESAIRVLDRDGTRTNRAVSDLSKVIETLPGLQASADHWNRMEERIKTLSAGLDLEVTKAHLCADVAVARAEALHERQKMGTLFSGVLDKLKTAPEPGVVAPSEPESSLMMADPLTGLPTRAYAEGELTRAHGQSGDCYMALFVVKRLALINAKFGYSRGDEVLLKVVTHLVQLLPNFNNLFRWTPCAFLTLAPPNLAYKDLRAKLQIIELARFTPTLEWEGRSAMVPVVIDCRLISVKDFDTPSELFLRIDTLSTDT